MGVTKVLMCRLPFRTHLFNQNQKVWVKFRSGNLAYCVVGKHRGKGRYITGWVSWLHANRPAPDWKEIEVDEEFAKRLGIL